jgi:hypothetical protein
MRTCSPGTPEGPICATQLEITNQPAAAPNA